MQQIYKPVILISLLILAGCTIKHNYVWDEFSIAPERISSLDSFTEGQELRIIKGKSDDSRILLGFYRQLDMHQFYGSLQSLTDGIATQLAREMRKKQLDIRNTAEKSLEITVDRVHFEPGTFAIAANIDFTVKFGNGKTKSYTVRNSSVKTLDQIYNGAVALAVIEIINDPEVRAYVNE